MALISDQKFSTFQNGGDLVVGDIIVGLRGGLNTRFNYTAPSPVDSITGTLNQVLANGSSGVPVTGSVILTTPQDIAPTSSPVFNNITLTGELIFGDEGNIALNIADVPNAVNYASITNSETGLPVIYSIRGDDADIEAWFVSKGTGQIHMISDALTQPFSILNGTSHQHKTTFAFANTMQNRVATFQDADGTLAFLSDIPGVTPSALTKVDDTNVTVTLGGTPATSLLQAVSLTMGWSGTLSGTRGGTGVNNGASTITLGGSLTTSGAFASTFTMTGITGVTFPTSGTLATTAQLPTPAALTKTDDTNVTLTLGGTPTTALLQATSLTLGWTGTLSGTRGGTGVNNSTRTITIGGNLTTSGAFNSTFTMTNTTTVTFPTSGTLATTSQIPTGAALTKTDDTNVTLTLGGSPTTALINAASLTLGWTGQLGLSRGGTNANLTAANGGIIYSTATAMAVLAPTVTTRNILFSGGASAPAWSTSTWPDTVAINSILTATSANVIGAIAPLASAVLISNGSSVPSMATTLPANLTIPTPTISGNLTFSANTAGIAGIINAASKAAGVEGEILSGVVTGSIAMTTATPINIVTLSLTAGNWLVFGELWTISSGGATLLTNVVAAINTVSATLPGTPATGSARVQAAFPTPAASAQIPLMTVGPAVIRVSGTTNVYLVGYSEFTGSAVGGYGKLVAYRFC